VIRPDNISERDSIRFLPEEINEIDNPLFVIDPEYPSQPSLFVDGGLIER
jgi:hypothetical protein